LLGGWIEEQEGGFCSKRFRHLDEAHTVGKRRGQAHRLGVSSAGAVRLAAVVESGTEKGLLSVLGRGDSVSSWRTCWARATSFSTKSRACAELAHHQSKKPGAAPPGPGRNCAFAGPIWCRTT